MLVASKILKKKLAFSQGAPCEQLPRLDNFAEILPRFCRFLVGYPLGKIANKGRLFRKEPVWPGHDFAQILPRFCRFLLGYPLGKIANKGRLFRKEPVWPGHDFA